MKTTLIIPDTLYRAVKQRAAQQGQSVSDLVADLLRAGLKPAPAPRTALPPLPAFHMGAPRVDIADRDALEAAMQPHQ